MRTPWRALLVSIALWTAANPSFADDIDEVRKLRDTTINLVNALVEQGVLTRAKADEIIAQAQQAAAKSPATAAAAAPGGAAAPAAAAAAAPPAAPAIAPGTVRVPYVPESVKAEIRDEVKDDVLAQAKTERWGDPGALPEWLDRFTWSGDMRVRAEADRFPSSGTPNAPVAELQAFGVNIDNSTESDNRYRIRARFGFEATVGETVTVGMRLATGGVGSGSNPGSENQTLGNYETRSSVGFDRAYLAYHPESWLTVTGGRLGDPFFRPTTLVWSNDLSLEGLAVHFDPQFGPRTNWFTTVGALPILQNDPTSTSDAPNKWLFAYQSGVNLRLTETVRWTGAAALYDYRNLEGIPNPNIPGTTEYSGTAAAFRQTGNTVFDINGLINTSEGTQNYLYGLASKFHVLNLSSTLDLAFIGATHVIWDADWVKNLGFDESEIEQRIGYQVNRQVEGWQSRLAVGYPTMARKYNWQAWIGYRYVQRDATVDAFTDQDFHLGGTDAKGYYLGGMWAFEKNSSISLRWFSAKQIDGVELAGQDNNPLVSGGLPLAIDVLQLDIISAF